MILTWIARRLHRSATPTASHQKAFFENSATPAFEPAPELDTTPCLMDIPTPPTQPPAVGPPPTWFTAELTARELNEEADVLDRLAHLSALAGPLEAARHLFGGPR